MAATTAPEQETQDLSGSLALLRLFTRGAGVNFDPVLAGQALRNAIREVPPTQARAARVRLTMAANALGLQLLTRTMTVRDMLQNASDQTPYAIFTITASGQARWFAIQETWAGDKARLLRVEEDDDSERWYDEAELGRMFGATRADEPLEWMVATPITPMIEASTGYDEILEKHTESTGHGHHHAHHLPPFRRLLGLLKPERQDLWIVLLFSLGVGIFTLATPVVAMAVVNTVALGTLVQQIIVLCVALFIALSLAGLLQFMQTVVVEYIQRRIFVRVAADLSYRLPRVDLRAFDQQHGPELVNRFFDVLTVQKSSATLLLDGITIALQIILGLILLGFYHTFLLGFDLILITCLGILFFVLGWGATKTAIRESIAKFAVAGWMEEIARHPIAFKLPGGPRFAMERTEALTRDYLLARSAHFRVLMRQFGFALLLQAIANVSLLGLGGYLVIEGDLSLGQLVAAELVVTLVVATFTKLGKQLDAYYDLIAAVDKLGHLIDLPLEREGGALHIAHQTGATLSVRDITFTYHEGHHPTLSHLDFQVNSRERVAIMGPNGAGKSTLVDILFGLRNPESGWVEIDGMDIRSIRLDSLRNKITLVKGIEIFEGSILANVRMGREDITLGQVCEALSRVGLLNSILELPMGLNTILWPGGSPLSLGQANRLMVARAIVGQPRLLILDESLDHLDEDVREKLLPAILGPDTPWTLLIVTHSESVARLCDRTITLEKHSADAGPHHHPAQNHAGH